MACRRGLIFTWGGTYRAPRVVTGPRVAPTLAADGAADDDGPAAVELVRLVRHQQDQLTQLAGQVGFLQAQLQQAHETIKLLQAPPDETAGAAGGGGIVGVEDRPQTVVMAEEVGHLKAELEQSRQRVAEFEAVTDELEREQEAAAAEGLAGRGGASGRPPDRARASRDLRPHYRS